MAVLEQLAKASGFEWSGVKERQERQKRQAKGRAKNREKAREQMWGSIRGGERERESFHINVCLKYVAFKFRFSYSPQVVVYSIFF